VQDQGGQNINTLNKLRINTYQDHN